MTLGVNSITSTNPRSAILLIAIIATLGVAILPAPAHAEDAPAPARRPNIVFIIADDERADMLGCTGNKYLETPHRDRLATEGMLFRNAFVTSAVCSPSRGSFLTGKHVHQCGTQPIIHMNYTFHRNERPFPAQLHDVGYHTAHFGKWHLGQGDQPKPGYDHWVGYYALIHFFNPVLTINGKPQQFEGYSDFILADLAADHIREVAKNDQPFCVYVAFCAPHYDFSFPEHLEHVLDGVDIETPPSVDEDVTKSGKPKCIQNSPLRYDRLIQSHAHDAKTVASLDNMTRRYMRSSLSLDESVGKIMQALEDACVIDDTLIIYTSDHGHMLGEHGLAAKHLPYEESVRIPMIVRYPRLIAPGSVRDDLVANIDVAPTLLDLAGAPIPDDVAGRSMRPLLEAGDRPVADWVDDYAFLHETCVAVRTHRYKLTHYRNVNERELYDLERDPYEITNLIDDPAYASVLEDMEQRLERHLRDTDFPDTHTQQITSPWLLGPFTLEQQPAIVAAALATPVTAQPLQVGDRTYTWRRAGAPIANMLPEFRQARWMWHPGPDPARIAPVGKVWFRRTVSIPPNAEITSAKVQVAVDNHYELRVNGRTVAPGTGWIHIATHDVAQWIQPGDNVIAFVGQNAGDNPNPAGLIAGLRIQLADGEPISLSSGEGWRVTDKPAPGWDAVGFDDSTWSLSQDLGRRIMPPWRTGQTQFIDPAKLLGGEPDDLFLLAFAIDQLTERDPFVRVNFNPAQKPVIGWVNGERLYVRQANDNPFNRTFNPPLVKGRNTLIFKARLGDYPALNVSAMGHHGKTHFPQ